MDRTVAKKRNLGDAINSVREHTRIGGGDEVKRRSRVDADVCRADGVAGKKQARAADREAESFGYAEPCHTVFPFIFGGQASEVVVCFLAALSSPSLLTTGKSRKPYRRTA